MTAPAHWVGCIFFFLSRLEAFSENTWVKEFEGVLPLYYADRYLLCYRKAVCYAKVLWRVLLHLVCKRWFQRPSSRMRCMALDLEYGDALSPVVLALGMVLRRHCPGALVHRVWYGVRVRQYSLSGTERGNAVPGALGTYGTCYACTRGFRRW